MIFYRIQGYHVFAVSTVRPLCVHCVSSECPLCVLCLVCAGWLDVLNVRRVCQQQDTKRVCLVSQSQCVTTGLVLVAKAMRCNYWNRGVVVTTFCNMDRCYIVFGCRLWVNVCVLSHPAAPKFRKPYKPKTEQRPWTPNWKKQTKPTFLHGPGALVTCMVKGLV